MGPVQQERDLGLRRLPFPGNMGQTGPRLLLACGSVFGAASGHAIGLHADLCISLKSGIWHVRAVTLLLLQEIKDATSCNFLALGVPRLGSTRDASAAQVCAALHARDSHGLRKLSEVLLCDFGSLLFSGLACSRCLMKLVWT